MLELGAQDAWHGPPPISEAVPRAGADWWRAEDGGTTVGYGWLDVTWGDAEMTLAVHPDHQEKGCGTFILEHLTPSGADTYKPEWPLVEGLLEVLDPPELEEWWESLRPLQLRVEEACGLWRLLVGDITASNRDHATGGSARAADLGTMASRFEQQQGEGMHEPEPETK